MEICEGWQADVASSCHPRTEAHGTFPSNLSFTGVILLATTISEHNYVALLNETHLKPTDRPKFPGYYIYRQDDANEDGRVIRGLVVLVKRRVLHQPLPNIQLESLTALGVEISTFGHSLRLYAVYRPPASILKTADLTRLLLAAPDSAIVAAGDWNCKHQAWNSCISNTAGNRLLRHAESNDYAVTGPDTPTHYPDNPNQTPDVIDLAVHKGLDARPQLEVLLDEMQSDHQPVLLTIARRPIALQPPTPRPKVDWEQFEDSLQNSTPSRPILEPKDVDELTVELTCAIQMALAEASHPPRQNRLPKTHPRLANLLREKRLLRKRWRRTRDPAIKTKLNALCEEVKAEVRHDSTQHWERRIAEASGDWASLHKLCRELSTIRYPICQSRAQYQLETELFQSSCEISCDNAMLIGKSLYSLMAWY
ncbi:putative endonuclease and reverse transcriptase-like protein [Operophtera brumata]|uniref:Putative endonuclease and reverse transcriptase-like protein n=1 Tax=Operophtera brumata TaxID=104452 RepID=A0A0L7LN74_OPEBR|nr:putative endonuclease and reverse transcriptase-like protein [Operophtera brumata]